MPCVIIESPYQGNIERNVKYARRCMKDSLDRSESPFLSHLLYTQVLDDTNLVERTKGINANFDWIAYADYTAVYIDYGVSDGMIEGINEAQKHNKHLFFRRIGKNEEDNSNDN
jgi:hypothetical protein